MSEHARRSLRQDLLSFMGAPGYRPATVKALFRLLAVPRDRRNEFKRALRDLLVEEEIVKVDGNRYAVPRRSRPASRGAGPPSPIAGPGRGPERGTERPGSGPARGRPLIAGTLQRHPRGFGFVTPDSGGEDLFIPGRGLGDLLDGDRVAVRVVRESGRGRAEGEVVRLLERSRKRVLGVYRSAGDRQGPGTVEAYDRLFENDILIPEGESGPATDGMVVGVEVTRPPSEGRRATGRIVEVLGHPDDPGMDLKLIVRKYDIRSEFPPEVLAEAKSIPEQVPQDEIGRREDFRRLPIVTIDGETAMDFDDAVHVTKNADGTYELQVHIADVSHYVRASSALDTEAYVRGTSVYFPGTAIPMLPHKLSNGICSLNPGVDRLVQSCLMTIDRHGAVTGHRFAQGVIRSAERMTYTNVAKILVDRDPEVTERYRALVPMFRLMEELCGVLNARRRKRGSIDFDLPEPEVILAVTGEMTGIVALERNIAHRLIEEFMLAANETVASYLWKARVPSIYRIHERPDPKKLEEFDAVARAFGYRLEGDYNSIDPSAFQKIVDMAKGRPEERFLSRLMLRSMKQARYSEKRDIHFGLATSYYTHFTSPIRRYPDLIVHRLLRRVLTGKPLTDRERQDLEGFLPEAALRSSKMERTADAAENELVEWKKMAFMAGRLGEEFDGFIISVHTFGFFVELQEFFVDGLIAIEALHDDHYRFLEKKQILKGDRHGRVFKLGDRVRVRVDRVNQFLLRLDFSLIEPGGVAKGPRPGERGLAQPSPGRPAHGSPGVAKQRERGPGRRRGRDRRG